MPEPLHPWIDTSAISLDQDLGSDLEAVLRRLTEFLGRTGRVSDEQQFVADVLAREARGSTSLPGGLGLPHARSAAVETESLAFARLPRSLQAPSRMAIDLVFLLGAPAHDSDGYLRMLKTVATGCARPGFLSDCRSAETAEQVEHLLSRTFK